MSSSETTLLDCFVALVNDDTDGSPSPPHAQFWCNICHLDLQSTRSLIEHQQGRKHLYREFQAGLRSSPYPTEKQSASLPSKSPTLGHVEFLDLFAQGYYQNIVVLTGAGVSTAAGIPDFRSPGTGMLEILRHKYAGRFPGVDTSSELLFSRDFVNSHPAVWESELLPMMLTAMRGVEPTATHRFCAYLARQGWLKRIYTQNIDGLHSHPSLFLDENFVVECHGSIRSDDLVLYGDSLPNRFFDMASSDFEPNGPRDQRVDLVLVLGTTLKVAPFCGLPNLAPKYCHRVWVNHSVTGCAAGHHGSSRSSSSSTRHKESAVQSATFSIGRHNNVSLKSFWCDRNKARTRRWRQLLVSEDCDAFVAPLVEKTDIDL